MTHRPPPVQTRPVRGPEPLARRLAMLVAVLLGIAIVKPWSFGSTPAPPAEPPRLVAWSTEARGEHAAVATPEPPPSPDAVPCRQPEGWRVASLERWQDGVIRAWVVVPPVADRPLGPLAAAVAEASANLATPSVSLPVGRTLGIGLCPPPSDEGRPNAALVAAWRVTPSGPIRLAVSRIETPGGDAVAGTPLYAVRDGAHPGAWPLGRFLLAFTPGDPGSAAGAESWWIAVEIGVTEGIVAR